MTLPLLAALRRDIEALEKRIEEMRHNWVHPSVEAAAVHLGRARKALEKGDFLAGSAEAQSASRWLPPPPSR